MRQTVVGVFDRYAAAQHAARSLQSSGFADSVFVTEAVDDSSVGSSATRPADEGVMAQVRNFFSGLFGSGDNDDVADYAEAVRRGGAVVKVEVDDDTQVDKVREALQRAGAVDIEEKIGEWRGSGTGGEAASTTAPTSILEKEVQAAPSESVIPVIQESIEVGKRAVSTGGVRVYAHTVTTPVHESVTLESEHVVVERRAVDRPATEADLGEKTIEMRETAEKPVVAKVARVVEEVVVGKEVEQHTEQVNETLRSTEVEVERVEAADAGTDPDSVFRSDFQTRYAGSGGSYADYEPAYRYGHSLGSDSRYTGRRWEEFEPDVRADWERQHPQSSWERFKDAVRHGWERVRS